MGLIKFKQIKPLPFEFRPRYWDPVKEKREERLKEIKAMQEDTVDVYKRQFLYNPGCHIQAQLVPWLDPRRVHQHLPSFQISCLLYTSRCV